MPSSSGNESDLNTLRKPVDVISLRKPVDVIILRKTSGYGHSEANSLILSP